MHFLGNKKATSRKPRTVPPLVLGELPTFFSPPPSIDVSRFLRFCRARPRGSPATAAAIVRGGCMNILGSRRRGLGQAPAALAKLNKPPKGQCSKAIQGRAAPLIPGVKPGRPGLPPPASAALERPCWVAGLEAGGWASMQLHAGAGSRPGAASFGRFGPPFPLAACCWRKAMHAPRRTRMIGAVSVVPPCGAWGLAGVSC